MATIFKSTGNARGDVALEAASAIIETTTPILCAHVRLDDPNLPPFACSLHRGSLMCEPCLIEHLKRHNGGREHHLGDVAIPYGTTVMACDFCGAHPKSNYELTSQAGGVWIDGEVIDLEGERHRYHGGVVILMVMCAACRSMTP